MEIKENLTNEIWLNYFNNVLYDKGVITEAERNKMKHSISNKYSNISARNKNTGYAEMPSVVIKQEKVF